MAIAFSLFAMPPSSVALLFSVVLGLTNAMPWAEPAKTAAYVADEWTPRPTGTPNDPAKLFKRASVAVAVCGWAGGNLAYPAECASGSSCIHDTMHALVGCCKTDGPCTQGVYTACIDNKSLGWEATSAVVNDGVVKCAGKDLCYQNSFPGGYSQYLCGDPASATSIETAYIGQPSDVRLQVVFTGVTFNAAPVGSSGTVRSSGALTVAPFATETTVIGAGKVSPVSAAQGTAQAPSGSSANPGTVAGGTVAGIAGLALVGAFGFWCLRRRQKHDQGRRKSSFFNSRKRDIFGPRPASFTPVGQSNLDEIVSPMTGHPDHARNFSSDTSYQAAGGPGGMMHRPGASFSTIARGSPFADEHPRVPSVTPGDFEDVARNNPFSDRNEYEAAPKPLSQRSRYSGPPRNQTPSPAPLENAHEQSMPLVDEQLVDEIDDFSRSWSEAVRDHHNFDHSDTESDHSRPQLQTATALAIPHGRSADREARSEALRVAKIESFKQMAHPVQKEDWEPPHLRSVKSEISSMHNTSDHQQSRNITAPVPHSYHYATNSNASNVSSLRGTPTPAAQATNLQRPVHPLEREAYRQSIESGSSNLQRPIHPLEREAHRQSIESGSGRGRLNSEDTTYSDNAAFSKRLSQTSLRPIPPPKSSKRDSAPTTTTANKHTSFGLTGAISGALAENDGWRGSGIDGRGWSPAWSGIGGGWLEGQSGMAMSTLDENRALETQPEGPAELPGEGRAAPTHGLASLRSQMASTRRKPVSGVPTLNSPSQLQTERGRKGTFGDL